MVFGAGALCRHRFCQLPLASAAALALHILTKYLALVHSEVTDFVSCPLEFADFSRTALALSKPAPCLTLCVTMCASAQIWLEKVGEGESESDEKGGDVESMLFNELLSVVDGECGKQKQTQIDSFTALINANTESWARLVSFDGGHKLSKTEMNDECRQDRINNGFGLMAAESRTKLRLHSNDAFSAEREYDLGAYLTSLIIRAHRLNPIFQSAIRSYFAKKAVLIQSGPIKAVSRCRIKAEMDYCGCDWPTSARIADMIRASVCFDTIADYIDTIAAFSAYIDSGEDAHLTEIIAIKNGFAGLTKPPQRYADVKFLIVVTDAINEESMICELQFLIRPILESKKANHEFSFKTIDTHCHIHSRTGETCAGAAVAVP